MLIFTMVWLELVQNPVVAYWTVNYYRDIIFSDAFDQISSAQTLTSWLKLSAKELIYSESASTIPVGKLCIIEYNAKPK